MAAATGAPPVLPDLDRPGLPWHKPGMKNVGTVFSGRVFQNVLLVVFSAALTFFALEAGMRVVMVFDRTYYEVLSDHATEPGADMTLADIIRLHDNDLVVYELKPGLQGTFLGNALAINSLGMRDRERTLKKAPGTYRIVGLGDSHTFGWGVEQEETYLARLEDLLEGKYPGRAIEVLNHGVPGYNTVQEVASLAERIDDLAPDLVIINYVNNDMDLPNFLADRPDPWSVRRSYLVELLRRRLAILRGSELLPSGLTHAVQDERSLRFRPPVAEIPLRFRPLYGWDNMVEAYRRLAAVGRARNIPYLLLINMDDYRHRLAGKTPTVVPRFVRELAETCRREGYIVVDPQDRIFRYLQENNLGTTAVWITGTDSHTNPLRHNFVAEEIVTAIEEAGLIK